MIPHDIQSALATVELFDPPIWQSQALKIEAQTHTLNVEGAAISYRSWNLSETSLPGLVLVHGFRAHARWWDYIAPFLAEDYRVVALSLSGMGDSGQRESYSRQQFAREVLSVADAAGFIQPAIIAHSYGGSVAVLACQLAPEKIGRAILIDAVVQFSGEGGNGQPDPDRQRFYPDRDSAIQRFRLIPPGRWPDPHILAYIARHSVVNHADGWTWKFDPRLATALTSGARPDMTANPVPFDYLYGDLSEIVSAEGAARICADLPQCGAPVAIPASHHHVMIEQPLALIAALRTLLATPRSNPLTPNTP